MCNYNILIDYFNKINKSNALTAKYSIWANDEGQFNALKVTHEKTGLYYLCVCERGIANAVNDLAKIR